MAYKGLNAILLAKYSTRFGKAAMAYMQNGMACLGIWGILVANPSPFLIRRGAIMSFGLYALGFLIMIGGLIFGAHLMHVPAHWIAVGAIVLLGIGIVTGVQNTRQKDPS
jgi:hypothetical protein